jgi:hypothetical protein
LTVIMLVICVLRNDWKMHPVPRPINWHTPTEHATAFASASGFLRQPSDQFGILYNSTKRVS